MYETAKLILGELPNVSYLEYPAGQDLVLYKQSISKIIDEEDEVLILADLFGGSPFMLASQVFAEQNFDTKVEIFTGMNLPMLLEISTLSRTESLQEVKERVVEIGCQGIVDFRCKFKEMKGDL